MQFSKLPEVLKEKLDSPANWGEDVWGKFYTPPDVRDLISIANYLLVEEGIKSQVEIDDKELSPLVDRSMFHWVSGVGVTSSPDGARCESGSIRMFFKIKAIKKADIYEHLLLKIRLVIDDEGNEVTGVSLAMSVFNS